MTIDTHIQNVMDFLVDSMGHRGLAFFICILSTLYDITYEVAKFNYRIIGSIVDEFSTVGNLWVYLTDNSHPLPYKVFKEHPKNARWFYNKNANTLYESLNCICDCSLPLVHCEKLPWRMSILSQVRTDSNNDIIMQEHYLDEWASTFFMTVYDANVVPPNVLMQCWSLHSGVWMHPNADYTWRLHIINNHGDNITFNNINCLLDEEDKLLWKKALGLKTHSSLVSKNSASAYDADDEADDDTATAAVTTATTTDDETLPCVG
jgi:hypothetical protein